jgi:hypothetical protein
MRSLVRIVTLLIVLPTAASAQGGGLGMRSTGRGGGGSGEGTIGTGGGGSQPADDPLGDVRAGAVVAPRGVSIPAVRRLLREQLGELRFCYVATRTSPRDIQGSFRLVLDVAADGTVSEASASEATFEHGESLVECMKRRAREWRFQPPRGGSGARIEVVLNLGSPRSRR